MIVTLRIEQGAGFCPFKIVTPNPFELSFVAFGLKKMGTHLEPKVTTQKHTAKNKCNPLVIVKQN